MRVCANNHPFVDGNKRTALAITYIFLRLNGHFIHCDSGEAYEFFMRLFKANSKRFALVASVAGGECPRVCVGV